MSLIWLGIVTATLEGVFFVNAASLFMLAAIDEKRGRGARIKGESTGITMCEGLIGGAETIVFFFVTLWIGTRGMVKGVLGVFGGFAVLTSITVCQRLWGAWKGLQDE